MRLRSSFFPLLIATGTLVATVGCSGKPENSPTIKKKFLEVDAMQKTVEQMNTEMQFMTAEIRRLSEENSELRALAPGMDGAVPALEKIDVLEKRLTKVEQLASEGVVATAFTPRSNTTSGEQMASLPTTTTTTNRTPDLENATLAGGSPKPVVAIQQQSEKPVVKPKSADSGPTTKKPAAPVKTQSKPAPATSTRGAYHTIENGETLDSIAAKYKIAPEKILRANGLPKGARLAKGQKLYVPGS